VSGGELEALVHRWNEKLVADDDAADRWPVRELGTVLRPGASEEEIAALEERLGVGLPPSYRAFLGISNGAWAQTGWGVAARQERPEDPEQELGFLDASRVGWFRDRDPRYLDSWAYSDEFFQEDDSPAHYAFSRRVPEVEYLDHEREQDSVQAKGGHLRYALQVSGDVDGYTILLNPLVVDGDGEWEAWDFGSKTPGAIRYRSFAALFAADLAKSVEYEDYSSAALEASIAMFEDESRSLEERANAAMTLGAHGEHERVLPFLVHVLANRAAPTETRQAAGRALGYIDDERSTAALVEAAADAEPRLQAAIVPPLAYRDEPDARRAALAILTAPDVEDWVIRSVWPGAGETVWQAWEATGDLRLLVQLAYCHDRRAVRPLADAIVNPDVDKEHRDWLIQYAWWPGDPAVVPALVAAAELPDAKLVAIGNALQYLGAEEAAVSVYARALRESPWDVVATPELGRIRRPEARNALLDDFREKPSLVVARALGWHLDKEIARALVAAADDPEWRLEIVDALEKTASPAGREALAELVARGDLLAARALARQRDERALPLLLEHLVSDDDALAFEGADGLRDLRSPAAVSALLAIVEGGADDEDVVACAAHALVSMGAAEAGQALEILARGHSTELRRLAEIWR
jgi:HEAT repeat protein